MVKSIHWTLQLFKASTNSLFDYLAWTYNFGKWGNIVVTWLVQRMSILANDYSMLQLLLAIATCHFLFNKTVHVYPFFFMARLSVTFFVLVGLLVLLCSNHCWWNKSNGKVNERVCHNHNFKLVMLANMLFNHPPHVYMPEIHITILSSVMVWIFSGY